MDRLVSDCSDLKTRKGVIKTLSLLGRFGYHIPKSRHILQGQEVQRRTLLVQQLLLERSISEQAELVPESPDVDINDADNSEDFVTESVQISTSLKLEAVTLDYDTIIESPKKDLSNKAEFHSPELSKEEYYKMHSVRYEKSPEAESPNDCKIPDIECPRPPPNTPQNIKTVTHEENISSSSLVNAKPKRKTVWEEVSESIRNQLNIGNTAFEERWTMDHQNHKQQISSPSVFSEKLESLEVLKEGLSRDDGNSSLLVKDTEAEID